jgi:hypothetical protein
MKLILKLVLFVIPILIISISVEFLFRAIPNDYSYKNEFLLNNDTNVEVLILGSSHSYYGVNPEYITKYNSFNLSHVSQSLNIDFLLLQKYNFKKLNTLILPISYFTFWSDLTKGSESFRIKNYLNYYNLPVRKREIEDFELFNSKIDKMIKTIFNYYINPLKKDLKNVNEKGYGENYKKSGNIKKLKKTGLIASKRHSYFGRENRIDTNLQIVEKIIRHCRKRNIKILLITTPTYKSYYNNLDTIQLAETTKYCDLIAKKHPECRYLNLLQDKRFQEEDFRDADHLSAIGARKLSTILNDYLD